MLYAVGYSVFVFGKFLEIVWRKDLACFLNANL